MSEHGMTYQCACGVTSVLLEDGPAVACGCGIILQVKTRRPVRFPGVGVEWVVVATAPAAPALTFAWDVPHE